MNMKWRRDMAILGVVRIGCETKADPAPSGGGIRIEGIEGVDYWFVPCSIEDQPRR